MEGESDGEGQEDGMEEGSLMDLISGGGGAVAEGRGNKSGEAEEEVEMITIKKDGVLVKVPNKKKATK